jgi:PIN domain nuclease of toxin-antitoxin system
MTDTADHEPGPLSARDLAGIYEGLLAESAPDREPALLAAAGSAWLAVFEESADASALGSAITHLVAAVQSGPSDEDFANWTYDLGWAYAHRAEAGSGTADFDRAIDCLHQVLRRLGADDEYHDLLCLDLACLCWDRAWSLRYGANPLPDNEIGGELDRLIRQVEALAVRSPDSDAGRCWQAICGLAYLERFGLRRRRVDLEVGISQVAASLWRVRRDTWIFGYAAAQLSDAYLDRAIRDTDPASVDLAISVGRSALEHTAHGDPLTHLMLTQSLAWAHQFRWDTTNERDELDAALRSWQVVVEKEPDDLVAAAQRGRLLRERAELDHAVADADAAIACLTRATSGSGGEDADWLHQLGLAHHGRWELTKDRSCLDRAGPVLARAATLTTDHDDLLQVYLTRMTVAYDAMAHDVALPHSKPPPSVAQMTTLTGEARAVFDRAIAADQDLRSLFAGVLAVRTISQAGHSLRPVDLTWVRGLLAVAARRTDLPSEWVAQLELAGAAIDNAADTVNTDELSDFGVGRALRAVRADRSWLPKEEVRGILGMAMHARATRQYDLRSQRSAERLLGQTFSGAGRTSWSEGASVFALSRAFGAAQVGDYAGFAEKIDEAIHHLDRAPRSTYGEQVLRPVLVNMRRLAAVATGAPVEGGPQRRHFDDGVSMETRISVDMSAIAAQLGEGVARNDRSTLRACAVEIERLLQHPVTRTMRVALAGILGQAYLEIARRDPFDRRSARLATGRFEEAVGLVHGEGHPLWPVLMLGLADSLRRSTSLDRARTRTLGISALSAYARRVTLQADPADAMSIARTAAEQVAIVTAWCLEDGAADDLVAALETGRGMVLQAATLSRGVPARLRDLGNHRLADAWEQTAGMGRDELSGAVTNVPGADFAVPDTLRSEVLAALNSTAGLFQPTTVPELRAAVVANDVDALVYLVAASGNRPGAAVIVSPNGDPVIIDLPDLRLDRAAPVSQFLAAAARADLDATLAARLADVGRWAWRSAMATLVTYTARWRLRRRPRLVLVPVGALGGIPWHAAYAAAGTIRRYAIEDVVISYSPSGRTLQLAGRQPPAAVRSALFVGESGGGLAAAGDEARAILETLYPQGTYLGSATSRNTAPATRAAVLDWIQNEAAGASMLHFACHAQLDPAKPTDAALLLTDGPLRARDLIHATRLTAPVIEQVVLAACTTSATGSDYDEAFSLSSTFLAAGAHTVFGSLWVVPDLETALFMFMIHHFLRTGRQRPAEALNAAQRWMLDPGRQSPPEMPAELARHCRRPTLVESRVWAAFTHLGR